MKCSIINIVIKIFILLILGIAVISKYNFLTLAGKIWIVLLKTGINSKLDEFSRRTNRF